MDFQLFDLTTICDKKNNKCFGYIPINNDSFFEKKEINFSATSESNILKIKLILTD